jgi:hypothetical protein
MVYLKIQKLMSASYPLIGATLARRLLIARIRLAAINAHALTAIPAEP